MTDHILSLDSQERVGILDAFFDLKRVDDDYSLEKLEWSVLFAHAEVASKKDSDVVVRLSQTMPCGIGRISALLRTRSPTRRQLDAGHDIYSSVVNVRSGSASLTSLGRFMTGVYSSAAEQSQDSSRYTGECVAGDSDRIASSDKTFGNVHPFIAKIIDAVDSNRTVLYVPEEKNSRLHVETIVSTWMRQIRQVLSNDWNDEQDAAKVSQSPLSSYREYWCERAANLRGILAQLGSDKIQILLRKLEKRKHAEYICRDVHSMSGSIEDELHRSVRVCELLDCIETSYEYFINARLTSSTNALEHLTREIWGTWQNVPRDDRVATFELYIDLLRRVSDQIIATCKAEVQLETIFQPDIVDTEDYDTAVSTLRQCSTIAEYWEGLRESICSSDESHASNPFIGLDIKTALSHLDAFTHRCKDLLEVCDAREQFAPPQQRSFPNANNLTHHDVDERLLAMKDVFFSGVMQRLRNVRHSALDMSSVKWHDEFAAFKTQLKQLETKLCEILEQALDKTLQLTSRVELLSLLYSRIARRDGVRRKVEACAAQTYALFAGELQFVKHQFDTQRQRPPIGRESPKSFGCVRWAASLLYRLESIFGSLTLASSSGTVPQSPMLQDLVATYSLVIPQIEQFMKEKHQEWFSCASRVQVDKYLCHPVLELRDNRTVAVTMPLDLQVALKNAEGFISISMDVPKGLVDLTQPEFSKTLRKMYESLASVVDRSDALLSDIQAAPHGINLFEENVEILRSLFQAASVELTWKSDLDVVVSFCAEVDDFCAFLGKQLSDFTNTNTKISQACNLLDTLIRPKVRTESLKTMTDFDAEYRDQFSRLKAQINSLVDTILALLRDRREVMCSSTAVLSAWTQYARDVQISIEEGLKKLFVQLISELNNTYGECNLSATRQQPFLVTRADLLQPGESEYVICTNPALVEMMDVLRQHFDETVDYFSRQISSLITDPTVQMSLCERSMCEMSGIIARVRSNINAGLGKTLSDTNAIMQQYRSQYEYLWTSTFDESPDTEEVKSYVLRLRESIVSIQAEHHSHVVGFLRIDCRQMKQSLLALAKSRLESSIFLLRQIAISDVDDVLDYFSTNLRQFATPPTDIDELVTHLDRLQTLRSATPSIPDMFIKPRHSFEVFGSFMPLDVESVDKLSSVAQEFENFKACLDSIEDKLDETKSSFRNELQVAISTLEKDMRSYKEGFLRLSPIHIHPACSAEACEQAWFYIEASDGAIQKFQARIKTIDTGLQVFKDIDEPDLNDIDETSQMLTHLKSLWEIVRDWNTLFEEWKDGKFHDLDVELMESQATMVGKRVTKVGRGIVKDWETWVSLRENVDSFRRLMPLIVDMRNPAIRDRHWLLVMDACGKSFDYASENFTLARVVELGLDQCAETISEISDDATKELAVDKTLESISDSWKHISLDTGPYKEERNDVMKLRSADEIFSILEDHTVTLSTLKASKFFSVFEDVITCWERALRMVNDVIEMVLKVQLEWMYLESIFIGSEDIAQQLPEETRLFHEINLNFISTMHRLHCSENALAACASVSAAEIYNAPDESILNELTSMDNDLERIQKSLDNYLELKRQTFPRFYFLSNDDLLQILGQVKDPEAIQPHLKGMFEGIKRLEMHPPDPLCARRHWQSVAMISSDGERISFDKPVNHIGRPEHWLNTVEAEMYAATKTHLAAAYEQCRAKGTKKEKWVKDNPGQVTITSGCIYWTSQCERALADAEDVNEALKKLRRKWIQYLNQLVAMTRSTLDKVTRKKLTALITIEVHARDTIEKLIKNGCTARDDFEWVSQLRFYWESEIKHCTVRQVLSVFDYGYEYQGNNGRLVVTPLTDRCYMTLGAAMYTRRGGNPLGPAGTGKTETVKDFGKALARYVIVFNCSDGVDYKMTGKMFSGLAQTGAWACLDEFNRITVEVLSVVATQISVVMAAVKQNAKMFDFEGQRIRLIPSCGVFVTMNPGYAGRAELPDNLKAIVRPVSMMVPDFCLIAEIMLFSEGFTNAKPLAKKMVAIMEMSQQQLSKQDHYDYTLRSFIIPISRAAGTKKRESPQTEEQVILFNAMSELIVPKLVYQDIPLFKHLLSDLFPEISTSHADDALLRDALVRECRLCNVQPVEAWISKIIQIFDCKCARHGNMIVGKTGSGKTTARELLVRAMKSLKESHPDSELFQNVEVYTINPLSLSNEELYGSFDEATHEWTDGVLSKIMRDVCKDDSSTQKWIVMDGPVDTLWIESMNTLLDDNKLLTLLSGERIMMSQQVSILFEVEDLSQASPATVSRAGMIYFNVEDLGWQPFIASWLTRRRESKIRDSTIEESLSACVDKYLHEAVECKMTKCTELVKTDILAAVRQLTILFDAHDVPTCDHVEAVFVFCLIWSIGASIDMASRVRFDNMLQQLAPLKMLPHTPAIALTDVTVFDYYYDFDRREFVLWSQKIPACHLPNVSEVPFFKLMVPTVDTVRTQHITQLLIESNTNVLIVGNVGVGKSMVVNSCLEELPDRYVGGRITFSAQTSSHSLQDTIEGKLERRSKGVFAPSGGRKLILAIDDFNMPKKSEFGFIPPLELLKMWHDNGFWYDRVKQEPVQVNDVKLLAAMAPPGGGRNAFSQRVMSIFGVVNMVDPSEAQLERIYSTILGQMQQGFDQSISTVGNAIVKASIGVYSVLVKELLPTPTKCHYLFNTRDLSKVIQGVTRATKQFYDSRESILHLWIHENLRVFGDRVWDPEDFQWLQRQIDTNLRIHFSTSWNEIVSTDNLVCLNASDDNVRLKECHPFVSFMRPAMDSPPYEVITDTQTLKESLIEKLEDYALESGNGEMELVLFKDAVMHVCRIHRILTQPKGNALLVGVGGSGRKSLARLAAYVAEMKTFSIEITKNYRINEFREDLKSLYRQAGVVGVQTVLILDDTQIVSESFLEDINNALTSGDIPGLYSKDEHNAICEDMRKVAKSNSVQAVTHDDLYVFFMERVLQNLHIVLCMSPIGDTFRERVRMFPGLVNCCTIDWFTDWPADALIEVAAKKLSNDNMNDDMKHHLCTAFGKIHESTISVADSMFKHLKRKVYITPTNFIEFVNFFKSLMAEKTQTLHDQMEKLRGGLSKLDETETQVLQMQSVCKDKAKVVADAKRDCEELLKVIVQDKRAADEQSIKVSAEAGRVEMEAQKANEIADECKLKLNEALPALQEAEAALNVLTKKDLGELKSYVKPPALVELCLKGVLTVLKRPTTWEEAKKQLGDSGFLDRLLHFDKDSLSDALLAKIAKYVNHVDYQPRTIGKVSSAAEGLCKWVHAMFSYGNVAREIAPKRATLKQAQDKLALKQEALTLTQKDLADVMSKVSALKEQYEKSASKKAALESEYAELEIKLERAEALVEGLSGEKTRWKQAVKDFEQKISRLPGDVCIAAAFMSYAGAFPSEYRKVLIDDCWMPTVKELSLPHSSDFMFAQFLADPSDVRDWNIQGLPSDSFSTENGVLATRGNRWPLLIDPQGQGNKWIKAMEGSNDLLVTTLTSPDMVRNIERAVQFGTPVLIQDVKESIDPILEHLAAKSFVKKGGSVTVKIGDKNVEVSPKFRLYFTSKLMNPHYTPEISTRLAVINFTVKEQGLNAQLRDLVVRRERPDLDSEKNDLVVKVARGKRKLVELEDLILDLLSKATGSLLDNIELINSLTYSKATSEEVSASLRVAEKTGEQIEKTAAAYAPAAERATLLYFTLYAFADVDPMYQFSLDSYTSLFDSSITKSKRQSLSDPSDIEERLNQLNNYHTYAVYRYASRGLFESHKLLLSLQICMRIQMAAKTISTREWNYLIGTDKGNTEDSSKTSPCIRIDWLPSESWSNVRRLALDFAQVFAELPESIDSESHDEWRHWYQHAKPETQELPGKWQNSLDSLQKLLLLKALRLDRVEIAIRTYVSDYLGEKFVDPPVLNLNEVFNDSTCTEPCIFVLSAGVDPMANLRQLAISKEMSDKLHTVALGQGQAATATELIARGRKEGHWVFLANCHLMLSWLPDLQTIIEDFDIEKPHTDFRLWLSSTPTSSFPLYILQRGLKITTEPPKGLRANLSRIYTTCISEESFTQCNKREKYGKLLFALSFFHALLLERKKFGTLGMNIPYDFNDTDFSVSDDILKSYLDGYEETPWESLRYLIGEANYGGRITDEIDRRIIRAYLLQFFNEDALQVDGFGLVHGALASTYHIPAGAVELKRQRDFVNKLPLSDQAGAFGQHANADMSYLIVESEAILRTCANIQLTSGSSADPTQQGFESIESKVSSRIDQLLAIAPEPLDFAKIRKSKLGDDTQCPLTVNMMQEIQRYNVLLLDVHESLKNLSNGIKGLVVMSRDMDEIFDALAANSVPSRYLKAYPSVKSLFAWVTDLGHRVNQLKSWALRDDTPETFWLAGFTYPSCFLTSVLQASARRHGIPIDTLTFSFSILEQDASDISSPPDEGVYVRGLYLEGAGWDKDCKCLCEPNAMELIVNMPVVHFIPTQRKRSNKRRLNVYECPLYMYPIRTGTRERPSFITMVELDAGDATADHWVKRGTALLLSL